MTGGSLKVVGTGIRFFSQMTAEARDAISRADHVLYLVDQPTAEWIKKTNASTESMHLFYAVGKKREVTYEEMVERILSYLHKSLNVCAAFYGHPGVYAFPSHEAIRRARAEGYPAVMLPGISAQDCLFADLGIDPGTNGYQSFEATDFLIHRRVFDVTTQVILWQVDAIGDLTYNTKTSQDGLRILAEVLTEIYGPSHKLILYEAPQLPLAAPLIRQIAVEKLSSAPIRSLTTLYIPPRRPAIVEG